MVMHNKIKRKGGAACLSL